MKRFLLFFKKIKKAFTLMECVCAIAVVGLLSAVIMPLTFSAVKSMAASDALRKAASEASANNATATNAKSETLYVTITYVDDASDPNTTIKNKDMHAESAFVFTKTDSSNGTYQVEVEYYDLKYGKETQDAD